jgi:hypothetical protein
MLIFILVNLFLFILIFLLFQKKHPKTMLLSEFLRREDQQLLVVFGRS